MNLGRGLYENSGCFFFFKWAVFFSFFSCSFYAATAIATGSEPVRVDKRELRPTKPIVSTEWPDLPDFDPSTQQRE